MAEQETPAAISACVLPWHSDLVQRFETAWRSQRLPHALMLVGAEGLGKRSLAAWFARSLLCERERTGLSYCGECPSCRLVQAGTHPDFQWIAPEEGKQQIAIDQLRAASDRLSQTSARHGWKVAVVEPAHQMSDSAANSLLKTLEEPTPNSLLLLVSSRPGALPVTIRSRCQQWSFRRPTEDELAQWMQQEGHDAFDPAILEFCAGAPLEAADYAHGKRFEDLNQRMMRALGDLLTGSADPTQIAQAWGDDTLPERLKWLDLWLSQRARAWIAGNDESITFPMRAAPLPRGPSPLNISAVFDVIDRIRLLKAQLSRTAVQKELAVEALLLELMHAMRPGARI